MKAFKKVMCIALAVVLASLALVAPVSAAKAVPLIVVNDMMANPLVYGLGTENEKQVCPLTDGDVKSFTTAFLTALTVGFVEYGLTYDNWDVYCNKVIPVINEYIDPIAYNPDGTPKYAEVEAKIYNCALSDFPVDGKTEEEVEAQKAEREAIFSAIGVEYGKKFGDDNVYVFNYDWRKSPLDVAADFNAFVDQVKSERGASKVNVVGLGEGSNILLTFMSDYNCSKLKNVVFASPAWQGTSIIGSLFTGDIELDIFAVENYLVMLGRGSFTTHFASVLISSVASYEGLSHEYFAKFNYILQKMLPRLYSDTINPLLKGIPALWSFVPADYYADAKAYMFPDEMNADLETNIDAYNSIMTNAKQIIEDAESSGVKFGIVCGYNCQLFPVNETYPTSDTVVDTCYASGGAVCADYLKAFDDWDAHYEQQIKDDHDHVSWDMRVDASTCMFPEQTWFIKNLTHTGYNANYGTTDVVIWLLSAKKQCTVHTDETKYPQFSLFNTYTRETKACPTTGVLGDVDLSTAVTVKDARLALRISAGFEEATEEQVLLGDIDEDGEISTADARSILCMALGIDE